MTTVNPIQSFIDRVATFATDLPADEEREALAALISEARSLRDQPNKIRVAVAVEGGMVTAVVSDNPALLDDVVIIDYDTDDVDESVLDSVHELDGTVNRAQVIREFVTQPYVNLDELYTKS